MEEPKPEKKPLSEKKQDALKKARVALIKARDEKRKTLHEDAFDGIIEKKLQEKLATMSLNKPSEAVPPEPRTESDEIIEIRRKPKKKIIVVESSSEEEKVIKKPKTKAKKKQVTRKKTEPMGEYVDPETYRRQMISEELYRNIFNR